MERIGSFMYDSSPKVNVKKSKPPILIRIEDNKDFKNLYNTYNIDLFDTDLFELKKKLKLKITENILREQDKLIQSQVFYENTDYFDNISNKTFRSKLCFDDRDSWLKIPYKQNLRNIYNNPRKKNKNFEIDIDTTANFKNQIKKLSIDQYTSNDNEKSLIALQLDKKKSKKESVGFNPTLSAYTKQIELIRTSPRYKDNPKLDITSHNDSKFLPVFELDRSMIGSSRPAFVDKLFKRYDYEELELKGKKVQNRTKEKAFNLALIKDLYIKLTK
jgi:hypothetical protein